jgi:single-strand DNA-binding protein
MASLNKVELIGHVGKTPEVKMAGNVKIANLTMATTEKWKDKSSGEMQSVTEWHRLVFFNKLADIVEKYVSKGSLIYVEGKIKTEKYTDKAGVEKYATKITANSMQLLSIKLVDGEIKEEQKQDKEEGFNDDIPF